METVRVERTRSDAVRLWNDDQQYLIVSRDGSRWKVTKHFKSVIGFGDTLSEHETAEAAVQAAKTYLQQGKDDLDKALEGI